MTRVRFIFRMKRIFQPVILEVLAIILFTGLTASFVSVGHVIANSISSADRLAALQFFLQAFANTEFAVQLSILAVLASGIFLLKDIYRSLRSAGSLMFGRQLA